MPLSGEHAMLARFQGRPGDLSPRARFNLFRGKLFPSKYACDPPFDRHDWVVTRPVLDAEGKTTKEEVEQRYVIDYYHAGTDEDGNEIFSLDARPALDSFSAVSQRMQVAAEELAEWAKSFSAGGQQ
jgi:cytochrome c heme-lyase